MREARRTLGALAVAAVACAALAVTGLAGKRDTRIDRYTVGFSPIDVAVGDFNRDGHKDLAVSNFQNPLGLSILRGRRNGRFKVAQTIALPDDQPHGIEVARLGKGKDQDLVVGTFGDNVLLLEGRKGVGFRPPQELALGMLPRRVAVEDFNRDGLADIAAARQDGDDVAVVLGQGGLGFGPPAFYPVGLGGGPIIATNVDPGGDPDLLTIDFMSDSILVFRGQAGGGFALTDSLVPPVQPFSFAVADLNRDGRRDVVAGLFGTRPRLAVFRGLEGGGFAAAKTLTVGRGPMVVQDIAVTRLNRDRYPDLIIVGRRAAGVRAARGFGGPSKSPPPSRVLVLKGKEGLKLRRVRQFTLKGGLNAVAAARFDRGRRPDVAVAQDRRKKRGRAVVILNP